MVKRLRENRKNKKGFTLVELIVVIVIILVLAAVMVPSVLRYVDKANKANTKSDAATILVDVQAQVADSYAGDGVAPTTVTSNGITVAKNATLLKAKGSAKNATYNETGGDVVSFSFQDGKHFIQWSKAKGWSEVDDELK
ncbi:prepilin-type N-terminal cleavage/methylation domain-containing protein [Blautia marasmi]|uniref:prepilin-type N-terminal cleavage/methylation domain-containing protein n=1 Tax=Blautia marasmi TaxID=1917868 RepID=UPI000CF26A49|nr:prepilin-type N-terminal cleavage/methylation domain-containing protein [Blautia marasmi]